MRRFNRPPNDPLFLGETQAFWMQFFYMEKLRERQGLAEQINEVSSATSGTSEELQIRRDQRKALLRAYNLLNTILNLPQENPDEDLEADIKAAESGQSPAFLKDRIRG